MITTWQFNAMDSLFFRDSRPMTAGESAWIESVFPPTGRTLQGAIRTAILDHLNIDYADFKNNKQLIQELGDHQSLGQLDLTGPWIKKNNIIYYPIPLDLVKNKQDSFALLSPSHTPITCDLGNIRLPQIKGTGYKTIENQYISLQGMQELLQGHISNDLSNSLINRVAKEPHEHAFADREPKSGLARNNQTRTAREGMLFAIAPIRPRQGVSLSINIKGLTQDRHPTTSFLQRLGGEGKLSHVQITTPPEQPEASINKLADSIQFKIVFTTHALMPTEGWLPSGYQRVTIENQEFHEYWQGKINDTDINIITACIGKPFKQGGWDHANHRERPLQAYVPAGSVYYCTAKVDDETNILALHDSKLGNDTEYGFGHILIGKW